MVGCIGTIPLGGTPPHPGKYPIWAGIWQCSMVKSLMALALGDGHQSEAINMDRDVYTFFFFKHIGYINPQYKWYSIFLNRYL